MWNLDSLFASDPIRTMITQDAAEADVVVVAMSSLDRRMLELIRVAGFPDRLTRRTARAPDCSSACSVTRSSRRGNWIGRWNKFCVAPNGMDRDFIWRWMGRGALADGDWLADSVEVLLSRKQAA